MRVNKRRKTVRNRKRREPLKSEQYKRKAEEDNTCLINQSVVNPVIPVDLGTPRRILKFKESRLIPAG